MIQSTTRTSEESKSSCKVGVWIHILHISSLCPITSLHLTRLSQEPKKLSRLMSLSHQHVYEIWRVCKVGCHLEMTIDDIHISFNLCITNNIFLPAHLAPSNPRPQTMPASLPEPASFFLESLHQTSAVDGMRHVYPVSVHLQR